MSYSNVMNNSEYPTVQSMYPENFNSHAKTCVVTVGRRKSQIEAGKNFDRLPHSYEEIYHFTQEIHALEKSAILFDEFRSIKESEYPPSNFAWERALKFLRDFDSQTNILSILKPSVSAADEESIDIYWEFSHRKLVINFPSDAGDLPSFAGRTDKKGKVSGYISQDTYLPFLTSWLIGK